MLPRIYAHLMSMSNFTKLLARRVAQNATAPVSAAALTAKP
jgi:hypothetical protein